MLWTNTEIAIPAFIGSVILFLVGLWLLKYLPDARGKFEDKKQNVNKYK